MEIFKKMSNESFIIVTPVYEDFSASSRLFRELAASYRDRVYVVVVDDGSVREPVTTSQLADAGIDGVVLRLRRNVGHQKAIAVGLGYVEENLPEAERVVVMDSDGEDVPETIQTLLDSLKQPTVDVAVARRKSRVETIKFRVFYVVYKFIFQLLTGRSISFGNFMAMRRPALIRLNAMHEVWTHVAAGLIASKLRLAICPIDRGPRYAGQSKMNFVGLTLHGFRALMVFAEDVLVRVGLMCVVVSSASVAFALVATLLKLAGYATPGWFSMALGVLFLVFLQTGTLTLMTLMLSGVARGGIQRHGAYAEYLLTVLKVPKNAERG
ncbi:glycosyltransferase [Xanthomonas campestris]|uniref:glycosyltransferase n=1 Tax=Xanthomonas campestris TaxID=339 RepID=UPI001EDEC9EC|nr:glycosyltransferase [Xanthomonas campestris]